MSLGGSGGDRELPMDGALPPELEGTFFRVGPASWARDVSRPADTAAGGEEGGGFLAPGAGVRPAAGGPAPAAPATETDAGTTGALHAVELREGRGVSYLRRASDADAGVFWHAGSLLALPEAGLPSQYSRFLDRETFRGGVTVPIASHTHRVSAEGNRVLFAVDDGSGLGGAEDPTLEPEDVFLRIGEWDRGGELCAAQSIELERATWQHDVGVTEAHVVFIESPTARVATGPGAASAVPFGWVPGAEGWLGLVPRGGDGTGVRWIRLDPCLVTHVLGAWEEGGAAGNGDESTLVLYVCRYQAPEAGRPVDLTASVVGPDGVGLSPIGDSLAVLERWQVAGDAIERVQVDERHVEHPRIDPWCEGRQFRYGYGVEMSWAADPRAAPGPDAAAATRAATPVGLLKFDLRRDVAVPWSPGAGRRPSEAVFVRSVDGHSDDEGWLLTVVDDEERGASDLYILDASALGRRQLRPECVVHLPERLPLQGHGEWVPAARYR